MKNTIPLALLIFFLGCTMGNMDMPSYVVGEWQSGPRETEWGSMTMKVTFNPDNTFEVLNYFNWKQDPLAITGQYRLEGSKLYCDSWNKGQAIAVSKGNNILTLSTANDTPIVLHRLNNFVEQ